MKLKLALLATTLLCGSTLHASPVTVFLGQSNENYTLVGTGDNGSGFGTYLDLQGACVAGATDTICTLTGLYTGATTGYSAGSYSLVTIFGNAEGGLPAISTAPVSYPNGGNFFTFNNLAADQDVFLDLFDVTNVTHIVPIIVGGSFVANGYNVGFVTAQCSGLPPAAPGCSQGEVGLYTNDSFFGPVTGSASFDTGSVFAPVPEPGMLALAGVPGMLMLLRRRFARTA